MDLESKLESMDLGEEVARQVAGTAGFDEDERHRISMAVREALINALKHGNGLNAAKKIGLNFTLLGDRLLVAISDEGKGFSWDDIPDPLADERLLATSGRGIFLMRCFMDDVEFGLGRKGGTVVTMTKLFSNNHKPAAGLSAEKEKSP